MEVEQRGNPSVVLGAWLLFALAYVVALYARDLADHLGLDGRRFLGGALVRGYLALGIAFLGVWVNRRALRRRGRLAPGHRFRLGPEALAALALLGVAFLLPSTLDLGTVGTVLVVVGSLIGAGVLMLRADLKEPERRTAARDESERGWSELFG